eukprot:139702_1
MIQLPSTGYHKTGLTKYQLIKHLQKLADGSILKSSASKRTLICSGYARANYNAQTPNDVMEIIEEFFSQNQDIYISVKKMSQYFDNDEQFGAKKMLQIFGSSTKTGIKYGIVGGIVGGIIGGPAGASAGYGICSAVSGGGTAIVGIGSNILKIVNSQKFFVLFEFGPKLQYEWNMYRYWYGKAEQFFTYSYYLRLERNINGYDIHIGHANKYLYVFQKPKIFEESNGNKKQRNCNGNCDAIKQLISTVNSTDYETKQSDLSWFEGRTKFICHGNFVMKYSEKDTKFLRLCCVFFFVVVWIPTDIHFI